MSKFLYEAIDEENKLTVLLSRRIFGENRCLFCELVALLKITVKVKFAGPILMTFF